MRTSVEILKGMDIFSELNDDELKKLATIAEDVSFKPGDTIIQEDVFSDSLYIVRRGCVEITKRGALIVILGDERPLGELSFFDKGLPSATAVAKEPTDTVKLPAEKFYEMMASDIPLGAKVFRSIAVSLCQKLRDTNEWLSTRKWLADISNEAKERIRF